MEVHGSFNVFFVDLEKVFDLVPSCILPKVLQKCGACTLDLLVKLGS